MDLQDTKHRTGAVVFIIAFSAFSVFLLSQIGAETKFAARGSLVAQPRFWPAVGVGSMAGFGLIYLTFNWRKETPGWADEMLRWAQAFEYLGWFMVYVWVVPFIGYLLATLIFLSLLGLRVGYRDKKMLVSATLTGLAIVLVFKTGLSVKIPGGAIYEHLPDSIRNFMIVNF